MQQQRVSLKPTQEDTQVLQSTPKILFRRSTRVSRSSEANSPDNIEFLGSVIALHLPSQSCFTKVRIVEMGCYQVHWVDYTENFSPDIQLPSICIFLPIAAIMDLETVQMDIIIGVLNSYLDDYIYMEVLRQWYVKIQEFLVKNIDFVSSPNDPCINDSEPIVQIKGGQKELRDERSRMRKHSSLKIKIKLVMFRTASLLEA
eukprot:IDg12159t1